MSEVANLFIDSRKISIFDPIRSYAAVPEPRTVPAAQWDRVGLLIFSHRLIPTLGLTAPPGGCPLLRLIGTSLLKVAWRLGSVFPVSLWGGFLLKSLVLKRPHLPLWPVLMSWD